MLEQFCPFLCITCLVHILCWDIWCGNERAEALRMTLQLRVPTHWRAGPRGSRCDNTLRGSDSPRCRYQLWTRVNMSAGVLLGIPKTPQMWFMSTDYVNAYGVCATESKFMSRAYFGDRIKAAGMRCWEFASGKMDCLCIVSTKVRHLYAFLQQPGINIVNDMYT